MANKKKSLSDKKGPASTVPKRVSNKDIRKARQAAKAKEERIPVGMNPKDYADAAFRKKVTIIMGSILLAFIIGLVVFLLVVRNKYDFEGQRDDIKQALADAGDSEEARAKVKIDVDEENHNFWITTLDGSYQLDVDDPDYGCYAGATITLQGQFVKRVFTSGKEAFWVYRTHDDHAHAENHHDENEETTLGMGETTTENKDTKLSLSIINDPIEIFFDGDVDIPADGTWVEITGIVGSDVSGSLAAVHHTEMKIIEAPEENH